MAKATAEISFLGGIEDEKRGVGLTGSANVLELKAENGSMKVLVDYGMFQGGEADDKYNALVDEKALSTDCIILTHAHIDHCGRIPMLIREGYANPIYMTEQTARVSKEILLDSVKINKNKIESVIEKNKEFEKEYLYYLQVVRLFEDSRDTSQNTENKIKASRKLTKILAGKDLKKTYEASKDALEKKGITTSTDIEKYKFAVPNLLYDEDDVEKMFQFVHFLEVGDKATLDNFYYINSLDETTLEKLFQKVKNAYDTRINVEPSLYPEFIKRIDREIKNTNQIHAENRESTNKNEEYKKQLENAYRLCQDNHYELDNKDQFEELFSKSESGKRILEAEQLLENEGIESLADIDDIFVELKKVHYDVNTLEKLKNLLERKHISNDEKFKQLLDKVSLRFYNASHIAGSVQALITATTQKISATLDGKPIAGPRKETLEVRKNHFLFSGDLGRIEDPDPNLPPLEIPNHGKLSFALVESTYAGREHTTRQLAEDNLFEEIKNASDSVVLPTFALHRTQGLAKLILEKMLEEKYILEEYDNVKTKIQELEASELTEEKNKRIEELKEEKKLLKNNLVFKNIIIDSPLAKKITDIYIKHQGDTYDILRSDIQEKLFGRQVVQFIEDSKQREGLYTGKKQLGNNIIITSSGMCEGGPVLSHLSNILQDPKKKVIFTGYTPKNSIGGKIKSGENVTIEGIVYEIKAQISDVNGFSGHIGNREILKYIEALPLKPSAQVIFNHGGEKRKELASNCGSDYDNQRKEIKFLTPSLGEKIQFKI